MVAWRPVWAPRLALVCNKERVQVWAGLWAVTAWVDLQVTIWVLVMDLDHRLVVQVSLIR